MCGAYTHQNDHSKWKHEGIVRTSTSSKTTCCHHTHARIVIYVWIPKVETFTEKARTRRVAALIVLISQTFLSVHVDVSAKRKNEWMNLADDNNEFLAMTMRIIIVALHTFVYIRCHYYYYSVNRQMRVFLVYLVNKQRFPLWPLRKSNRHCVWKNNQQSGTKLLCMQSRLVHSFIQWMNEFE